VAGAAGEFRGIAHFAGSFNPSVVVHYASYIKTYSPVWRRSVQRSPRARAKSQRAPEPMAFKKTVSLKEQLKEMLFTFVKCARTLLYAPARVMHTQSSPVAPSFLSLGSGQIGPLKTKNASPNARVPIFIDRNVCEFLTKGSHRGRHSSAFVIDEQSSEHSR